jgi:uncharacterized protein with von Willebrand factor type A (vWA) domain
MTMALPTSAIETISGGARERLAGFARILRDNGFRIGLKETQDALAILASPAAERPMALKPALRALFSTRHSDWARFDEIFDAYWLGVGMRGARTLTSAGDRQKKMAPNRLIESAGASEAQGLAEQVRSGDDDSAETSGKGRRKEASPHEALRATDMRLTRRERASRKGLRLDLRRTIHRNISRGGVPVDLVFRRRKPKPLRLVILLDASGSMNLYTAFFVRFIHGVVDAFREAEAFLFHTRLAHVSASLRDRDVTRAVDRLALMAQGVGGGTRIGESLSTFNRWHAKRVIHSRTAVMIVSDGYDTGAPEELALQMRRLRRRCRRIIWLNPLIGWRDYAPLARGMQAALPYIDLFAPAHNLDSLAALEPHLARI